ncbi:NAD-dependent deacylase [Rhodocaloribacter litoris]|uniref:SIR2 family NAD-dependent protein deacylase n=1 Tax=Rhodocaloribacter litoris TaxID=2558931 RepID=UPI001E2B3114|nr:NAD-dependent deacylase [Rhodocaloribacter litoris]QXD14531.1 NAD-dependent deacylase [Rhodocaloribacter litoris]
MTPPFSDILVRRLARARRVAVLTGAGISAESGIATFRDPGGIWEKFSPEELANVRAFLRNPELVQGWYAHRRRLVEQAVPNPGHEALAALERMVPDFTLITQNVDGLHQRAGSRGVVELHGNLTRSYCIDCRRLATAEDLDALAEGVPARCPDCGGLIRPDVVWFGEYLPVAAFEAAEAAARRAEVFLSIGTSAVVYPAAGLPLLAREHGAYVAEVNLTPSAIAGYVDEVVEGAAGAVLPRLVQAVRAASRETTPASGVQNGRKEA